MSDTIYIVEGSNDGIVWFPCGWALTQDEAYHNVDGGLCQYRIMEIKHNPRNIVAEYLPNAVWPANPIMTQDTA